MRIDLSNIPRPEWQWIMITWPLGPTRVLWVFLLVDYGIRVFHGVPSFLLMPERLSIPFTTWQSGDRAQPWHLHWIGSSIYILGSIPDQGNSFTYSIGLYILIWLDISNSGLHYVRHAYVSNLWWYRNRDSMTCYPMSLWNKPTISCITELIYDDQFLAEVLYVAVH